MLFEHGFYLKRPGTVPYAECLNKDTLSRLTLCPQSNCHAFSLSADFLSGSFLEIFLQVSNSLDPDWVRCFVRPDLDTKGLQKLSADDTSRYL